MMTFIPAFLLLLLRVTHALAPLEPTDGTGIHLGAWYDILDGDTPVAMNNRVNYKPLSFYQVNVNIGDNSTLQAQTIANFSAQVAATNSSAFLYLTVYPMNGFDSVTTDVINQFVGQVLAIVKTGQKVLIRYASEMNGSWFLYGQQPTAFKASWNQVVWAMRNATAAYPGSVSFLWAPNLGSGYPFVGYGILPFTALSGFDPVADTNKNGQLDSLDDPYSPYYPGDATVDWVGMSIYHYANSWPYQTNDIPPTGKLAAYMSATPGANFGAGSIGSYDFYEMFSGGGTGGSPVSQSAGGKPFFLSETGAAVHLEIQHEQDGPWSPITVGVDGASRAAIRQAWWQQFLNPSFLAQYPKFKGASFFEFTKDEDITTRDFCNFGKAITYLTHTNEDAELLDAATLVAFQQDMAGSLGNLVIWASSTTSSLPSASTSAPSATGASATTSNMPASSNARTGTANSSNGDLSSSSNASVFMTLLLILYNLV